MNRFIGIGRLVRDPEIRYTTGENQTAVARYTLAIDRRFKRDGEQSADFINCVAFGKQGEFVEKYLHKGMKIAVEGRVQTGSYEKDGRKVYTTDIVVENHEFCESKKLGEHAQETGDGYSDEGFMPIPGDTQEQLPFA